MNNTRNTIRKARTVAIASALTVYMLTGMFFNLLRVTGSPAWMLTAMSACAALWMWDAYTRHPHRDYTIRMALLGSAYGMGAAGIATLVS